MSDNGSGGSSSFFRIPGNIKQQMLPFVLNPNAKLNLGATTSGDLTGGSFSPQFFSFRSESPHGIQKDSCYSGSARINILPSTITEVFNNDISYKLLFKKRELQSSWTSGVGNDVNAGDLNPTVTLQNILNSIPGIQIREFLPDTRLDQAINLFSDIFSQIQNSSISEATSEDNKEVSFDLNSITQKIKNAVSYFIGDNGFNGKSFVKDVDSGLTPPELFTAYKTMPNSLKNYILRLPFFLYYTLQSSTTTNIYEVPGSSELKLMMESNGDAGWSGTVNKVSVKQMAEKIPGIGEALTSGIIGGLLNNVAVNFMPWWDASKGSDTPPSKVDISFHLVNDSFEAAMKNFIFVNTIVPNNRFLQYNLFQHSSNIYDVKIEGYNRLFACSGSFSVESVGVTKEPHIDWVNELVRLYANKNAIGTTPEEQEIGRTDFYMNIVKNKLIRIPEAYLVKLSFSSLLPMNLNTYLFYYSNNYDSFSIYKEKIYTSSSISDIITRVTGSIIDIIKS